MNKNIFEILKMNKKKNVKETKENTEEVLENTNSTETDNESKNDTLVNSELTEEKTIAEEKSPNYEEKFKEVNDKFLRLHAEFDNYRKRTNKERIDLIKYASEDVVKSMLSIIDDLERAIKSMEGNEAAQPFIEGTTLIFNKFKNILIQKGLEEIKTDNEVFNTDFHEAITNISVENEEQKGKIVEVIEKGYMLNGKVIRFAKVVVGN